MPELPFAELRATDLGLRLACVFLNGTNLNLKVTSKFKGREGEEFDLLAEERE